MSTAEGLFEPASLRTRPSLSRRIAQWAYSGLGGLALVAIVGPALWIIGGVIARAAPHWHWSVLTTTGSGLGGGLANEIVGTLVLTLGVLILAGIVGTVAGVYLAEYGDSNRVASFLRGASEVLAGIPSITLGYVGYVAFVVAFHWGFSLIGGIIVLSIMVVPYITKTTEVALRQVPSSYREGGEALGMPPTYVLRKIVVRSAIPGMVTGLIIAIAISIGETAPLLYTAGYSNGFPQAQLTHNPVGYLTYAVWTFYNEPAKSAVYLAYDAALLLIVLVLALILVSRLIVFMTQRHTE